MSRSSTPRVLRRLLRPRPLSLERLPKSRKMEERFAAPPRVRGTSLEVVESPVRVRIIRPAGGQGPGPVMVWIHGGGYIGGRARMDDRICSRFAQQIGISVVSVEYRLAPEHPFPAGLDDCFAALAWTIEQPWVEPARVVVGGASAGGGLAAALVQRAVDAGVALRFQLLVYPMLDDRTSARSTTVGDHLVWDSASNHFAWRCYLGRQPGGEDLPDYAAPARRADLSGLPPAWIGVGTDDLFYEEDVDYAQRLEQAGVPCQLVTVPGGFHASERLLWWQKEAKAFNRSQIDAVRAAIRPTVASR